MVPPPSPGPAAGDLPGRLLAKRYRLNKPIASGGMAQVWEATDEVLARRVAVKLLHSHLADDDSFVRRFRAEAIAAARLAHPSIVSVYDTFSEDGLEAIVMELVSGTTMRADLDQHGPLRLEAVLAIGTQVADALGAAHASGLVHRDVKPANILLSADGRVLVADFGIAKAAEGADLTSDGSMVGTAKYLAPEQVEGGAIDGRADLYALGVVLYEALTGTAPFVADTDAGTAFARLHRDPVPPRRLRPQIPTSVEAVVLCAMERSPDRRFASASAMRNALLGAGADPGRAPAAARAAVAADTGERPAVRPSAPPPAPRAAQLRPPTPSLPPPAALRPAPPAPAPPARPAGPGEEPAVAGGRRRRPVATAVVLVLVVALIGGGLWALGRTGSASGSGSGRILTLASASSFDPIGGDGEHDPEVPLAIDGDPATAWTSEAYNTAPSLGKKDGMGLVVDLDEQAEITRVDVRTVVGTWNAQIYATAGDVPTGLGGWGEPVGTIAGATEGLNQVEIADVDARHVLVWFTSVPEKKFVEVSEITVRGR